MENKVSAKDATLLGADQTITRRDFIGTTLLGAGAVLLTSPPPTLAQGLGDAWTGFGGIGDYALSNGNTATVVNSAHGIRDRNYEDRIANAQPLDPIVDVVVIGSGFAGISAAYEFVKTRRDKGTCLILDNHPVFGGEAKQNEFEVDGHRLYGPQGSNDTTVPRRPDAHASARQAAEYRYWTELGLPMEFGFGKPQDVPRDLKIATESFGPMFWDEDSATTGYFFESTRGQNPRCVKDIWRDKLERAPFDPKVKRDLLAWRFNTKKYHEGSDEERWLDSMSYGDFIEKVMQLAPEVCDYIDPIVGTGDSGLTSDVLSAYAAWQQGYPGVNTYETASPLSGLFSFPGGNSALLRHFVKTLVPDAIVGKANFADILTRPINFAALDRSGQTVSIRQSATVVAVHHEGPPETADLVRVIYSKRGELYRLRARAVVMCIGGWVAKHVVRDLPQTFRDAFAQFHHGPILTVNVALRNWRFMERAGISAARWFDGLGFFANIRRPMIIGKHTPPLHPDKPIVLTFYISFAKRGFPIAEQASRARLQLFSNSYASFEQQIRAQMQHLFGDYGFDSRRDIAGIILNRWGHALVAPQPGFFFGRNGARSPTDVIRSGFGRITFGHSELGGFQDWVSAVMEGSRASRQATELL